ncbi:hypothetical protein [Dactylosporangium sp. NPDC048998]|uniref:hypothetical protein n=1 Tax=Dactylosporangium sp. NPDC048998 TaxID=3363976 RepID=UPI00371BABAD
MGSALYRGQALYSGDYIQRIGAGGWYCWLVMQSDDNLVLYKGYSNHAVYKACWASNTGNRGWNSAYVVYQNDGNFVMYDYLGYVYWASNSVGDTGTTVDINNKGQLYVGYEVMNSAC